jgi:hypothetical protein
MTKTLPAVVLNRFANHLNPLIVTLGTTLTDLLF